MYAIQSEIKRFVLLPVMAALLFTGMVALGHEKVAQPYPAITVGFTAGSSELTAEAKDQIRDFVTTLDVGGHKIDSVYVAAFGDEIRLGDKSLSNEETELARLRSEVLRDFLEKDVRLDTHTYNMAKKSHFISRVFDTEEAKIKGDGPRNNEGISTQVAMLGKPSNAVLVIEYDR